MFGCFWCVGMRGEDGWRVWEIFEMSGVGLSGMGLLGESEKWRGGRGE